MNFMRSVFRRKYFALSMIFSSVVACAISIKSALADSLSAIGGLSFGRNSGMNNLSNTNPIVGAEYTFNLSPRFELGGFYDYMLLSMPDGNAGSIRFMGMTVRLQFADPDHAGLFVDTKLGVAQREEIDVESNNIPTAGAGVGYRIPLSKTTSLSPRVDLQYLPDSTVSNSGRQAFVNAGLMFSIHL
jgi:hypothetical protein